MAMMPMDSPARTNPSDSFGCGMIFRDMGENFRKTMADCLNVRLPTGNVQWMTFQSQLLQFQPQSRQIAAAWKSFKNGQNLRVFKISKPVASRVLLTGPGEIPGMTDKLRRELIQIERMLMETSRTVTTNCRQLRHFLFANAKGIFSLSGLCPGVCLGGDHDMTGAGTKPFARRV